MSSRPDVHEKADDIINEYKNGATIHELRKKYNCSFGCMQKLLLSAEAAGKVVMRKRGPKTKLSRDQMDEMAKMRASTDLSYRQIGEKFGVTGQRVEQVCSDYGIPLKQGRFMKTTDVKTVCELYQRNCNMKQISELTGFGQPTIKSVLCEAGLMDGTAKR